MRTDRTSITTGVVLCVWLACAAGCKKGSSNPAPTPTPTPTTQTISGTVTDAIRGSALTGVTVTIDQVGNGSTNGSGQFTVQSTVANGRYSATLSGGGVVTRQTALTFPANSVPFTLIPSTFDLTSFEAFARHLSGGAITRWSVAPALIVETSLVGAPTAQNVALAEQVSSGLVTSLIDRLTQALPQLTGSTFSSFASVTRQTTAEGKAIEMYANGAITVAWYTTRTTGQCGIGGPAYNAATFDVIGGAVWLDFVCNTTDASTDAVKVHEMGHALGYDHVTTTASVMQPTCCSEITSFDRDATTIVFRRPAGNRAPDVDPSTFKINGAAVQAVDGRIIIPHPLR